MIDGRIDLVINYSHASAQPFAYGGDWNAAKATTGIIYIAVANGPEQS